MTLLAPMFSSSTVMTSMTPSRSLVAGLFAYLEVYPGSASDKPSISGHTDRQSLLANQPRRWSILCK